VGRIRRGRHPLIETLGDSWGELCVMKELASLWADNLIEPLEATWRDHGTASYFQETPVCLSSLLAAGRDQELLDLLEKGAIDLVGISALGCAGLGCYGEA
jgi:hypothetical protein